MERLYLWPESPQVSILVLIVGLIIFMYFAREPMQNVLRTLAQAISGGLHLFAKWSGETAEHLRRRSRELVIEAGRDSQERRLDHEFRRLESSYAKDLADYPKLHLKLDEKITGIDDDYTAAAQVPPEVPGWSELVESVAKVKGMGESTVNKMLEDIHRSAVAGEKKALLEYRAATAKRHKILAGMAPYFKELKGTIDRIGKQVSRLLDSTRRIDSYMERYEKIRGSEDRTARALSSSAVKLFVISLLVITIAAGAAFINFQLIALPMSELVPSGTRLLGMPVATVAALVIVLMEVAAGIFLLDTLGITGLFPQLSTLPTSRRRIILVVAFLGLLLLASIESSLAVLREQLVEAEMTLMESLAGGDGGALARATGSLIPVVGQAVLGFTLPWILAMIAIPLEMLIDSGRHVGARILVLLVLLVGGIARLLAYLTQYLILLLAHLYDACIMIPVQIERWIRGDKAPKRAFLSADDLTHAAAVVATPGATGAVLSAPAGVPDRAEPPAIPGTAGGNEALPPPIPERTRPDEAEVEAEVEAKMTPADQATATEQEEWPKPRRKARTRKKKPAAAAASDQEETVSEGEES